MQNIYRGGIGPLLQEDGWGKLTLYSSTNIVPHVYHHCALYEVRNLYVSCFAFFYA